MAIELAELTLLVVVFIGMYIYISLLTNMQTRT